MANDEEIRTDAENTEEFDEIEEQEAPAEEEFEEESEEETDEESERELTPEEIERLEKEEAEFEAIKAERRKKNRKEIRDWLLSLVAAVIVVVLVRMFVFSIIRVDGSSMADTLVDGERLYVSILTSEINGYERGDVVICNYPKRHSEALFGLVQYDTFFVKRLVGMPGDTVYRENGVTYVVYTDEQGNPVTEALDPLNAGKDVQDDYEAYVLAEDEYFVVGDNRYNSNDSRNWNDSRSTNDVGPIRENMLVGEVRSVIWPLGDIRKVD